jgi:hypothetical protein
MITRLLFWILARRLAIKGASPALPPWLDSDAADLVAFLGTPAGAKLRARLQAHLIARNANAVAAPIDELPRRCGAAIGYRQAIEDIEILSGVSPIRDRGESPTKTAQRSPKGADRLRERLAP